MEEQTEMKLLLLIEGVTFLFSRLVLAKCPLLCLPHLAG